ncbi:DUF3306 domain-containing protein [Neptunomonas sp.]|uniref:DUF3306 domain-containing protein n=1 Tax=Neptunomonas sp. TaxID=1971898 RepID=UPI0025CE8FF6|nr:DUF3306 domain-containing protein [Neptunomonas sp.]
MNDKTFISRWSRLKSERAAQALETKSNKPEGTFVATHNERQDSTLPDTTIETSLIETGIELHESNTCEGSPDEKYSDTNLDLAETPPLTDEDMPPLESLNEESNFNQFFSSGVSDELRNLALRRLFNLPQFNIRDGLNDYDEDFSKMPALAQEVAAKMRSWLHEKQDELTTELTSQPKKELTEELSLEEKEEAKTPTPNSLTNKDIELLADEDDDLGDADLEG